MFCHHHLLLGLALQVRAVPMFSTSNNSCNNIHIQTPKKLPQGNHHHINLYLVLAAFCSHVYIAPNPTWSNKNLSYYNHCGVVSLLKVQWFPQWRPSIRYVLYHSPIEYIYIIYDGEHHLLGLFCCFHAGADELARAVHHKMSNKQYSYMNTDICSNMSMAG